MKHSFPPPATVRSHPGTQLAASLTAPNLLGASADAKPAYGRPARDLIGGARVLVTGAGGSIGSELVRQIRAMHPAAVTAVDRDEYGLYRLELAATGQALLADPALVLADVTSRPDMDRVFAEHCPEVVFHAAAVKHVPLLERFPAEAIRVNVGGTATVAALCAGYSARLVNVSTDKAADPANVLGMTKRLAEVAALGAGTGACSVRFGNVFNSRGSFIETLTWQITGGLPVTLTDARMYRYFMTIPQAAGLVIEAAVMADGESTFVLDMGSPYRVETIVRRYAGLIRPDTDPGIVYTGARQGEKMTEVLGGRGEVPRPTAHPRITAVRVREDGTAATLAEIVALIAAAADGEPPELLRKQLAALAGAGAS